MRLTRIERNKIYEAIVAGALDPAECTLNQYDDHVEIRHKNSGSTFKFSPPLDTFFGLRQRVAYEVVDGHNDNAYAPPGIDNVTPSIRSWANEVKQIVESPDLWVEMQSSRGLIASIQQTDSSNALFTQDEQRQIAVQLQEIKKQLKERSELTSEQIEQIEERLDEAAEAGRRMGRKDWLIYFLGSITALIITATVAAGVGEHILTMVVQGLAHLFTGGSEPPRILA